MPSLPKQPQQQLYTTTDELLVFQNKRLDPGLYWLVEKSGHILLFVPVCCTENHHPVLKDNDRKSNWIRVFWISLEIVGNILITGNKNVS